MALSWPGPSSQAWGSDSSASRGSERGGERGDFPPAQSGWGGPRWLRPEPPPVGQLSLPLRVPLTLPSPVPRPGIDSCCFQPPSRTVPVVPMHPVHAPCPYLCRWSPYYTSLESPSTGVPSLPARDLVEMRGSHPGPAGQAEHGGALGESPPRGLKRLPWGSEGRSQAGGARPRPH